MDLCVKKKRTKFTPNLRAEFAQLWIKKAVHKNKKKYTRKLKHKNK